VAPSVQRRKVWLTPTTWLPCTNAAKTRNPLKFAGVPQTTGSISSASGSKFTILWGHEDILLLKNIFPIVDMCPSCEDIQIHIQIQIYIAPNSLIKRDRGDGKTEATKLCDGAHMAIFADFFASCISREPHAARFRPASEIRTKATPCVWKYGRHPICDGWD